MSSGAGRGAILGLRRAAIPLAIGVVCFLVSFWGIDDMVGLLRGLGGINVVLAVLLVGMNAWNGHTSQEPLEFKHDGYEGQEKTNS